MAMLYTKIITYLYSIDILLKMKNVLQAELL